MKNERYTQCELKRGKIHCVAWIPTRYARRGRTLRIRQNHEWSDGWNVQNTYAEIDERYLPDSHSGIRNHRKRTGDAETRLK